MFGIVIDKDTGVVIDKCIIIKDYTKKENEDIIPFSEETGNPIGNMNKPKRIDEEWVDTDTLLTVEQPNQISFCLEKKIQESKQKLEEYLTKNPLFSKIHNPDGEYYTITQEKQTQLTQMLTLAQLARQSNTPFQPTWNSSGGMCEPWTIEELIALSFEISQFVLPRVKKQQEYELQIKDCTTIEQIKSLVIDYDTI